jgi:hypothetical protein
MTRVWLALVLSLTGVMASADVDHCDIDGMQPYLEAGIGKAVVEVLNRAKINMKSGVDMKRVTDVVVNGKGTHGTFSGVLATFVTQSGSPMSLQTQARRSYEEGAKKDDYVFTGAILYKFIVTADRDLEGNLTKKSCRATIDLRDDPDDYDASVVFINDRVKVKTPLSRFLDDPQSSELEPITYFNQIDQPMPLVE